MSRDIPAHTQVGPPSRHQLALMIWLAVFATLTIINLLLGGWLKDLSPVVRTFVLATIAVPILGAWRCSVPSCTSPQPGIGWSSGRG